MTRWPVIGVVGGSGGAGASTFAAVLAYSALTVYVSARPVLVDLDPVGGGLDVLLGAEAVEGRRWSGLRLGGGYLAPAELAAGLPAWSSVAVLAADSASLPSPDVVGQALDVAAEGGPVIVDLGRWPGAARHEALARCRLVALLTRSDVHAVTGARMIRADLAGTAGLSVGVLVRVGGSVPSGRVADLVGAPLLGRLPRCERLSEPLSTKRLPTTMARVARGVLEGVSA